jgi:hypothetical protein
MTTGELGLKDLVLGDGATPPIGLDDRVSGVKNLASVSIVCVQPRGSSNDVNARGFQVLLPGEYLLHGVADEQQSVCIASRNLRYDA